VLHVGGVSDITDYLVLATGNSEPHLRALRIEAEKILDAAKVKIAGMDSGGFNSGWTVVDAYQIMIHFFTSEQRENYALEKLWKDAPEVDLRTFAIKAAAAPKAKQAKAPARKKTVAKKAPAAKPKKPVAAKAKAPAKKKPTAKKK
jgi:ribosome-associated protein